MALGPDLPSPDQGWTIDAYIHRWPTGTEKVELFDGIPIFVGQFDERDVETARRCFPGRQVLLNEDGGIEIHPASDQPARTVIDMGLERLAQLREARRDRIP
jgi:hypothetical protein